MKKRVIAIFMAIAMTSGVLWSSVAADDTNQDTTTESTTESTTEATTEKTTESTTAEVTTTTTTKTEATTTAATTTTKKANTGTTVSDSKTIKMRDGDTYTLSKDVSSDISSGSYTWKSSDEDIVIVSSTGKLTTMGEGSCTVTAKATSGNTTYSYTFDVYVQDPDVTAKKNISIDVDDDKDLYDYVSSKVSAKDYTWESEKTKYVTVNSKGVITGEKKGEAKVTAYYSGSDYNYYYVFNVTVDDDDDDDDDKKSTSNSKVSAKTSWTIYLGTGDKLDISDLLEDDPDDYDWDVDDEDIVTINESSGKLTAEDEGSTKVYAEGDDDYTFTVKVDDDYSTDEIALKAGNTKDLEDLLDDDVDEYSFSTDRSAVATVSSSGKVTAKANGVASIICKHEDGEIIQVFVTVTGGTTTTTTTTEKTTETTTAEKTTVATTTNQTTVKNTFNDISHRAWAITAINNMASQGFIVGRGNSAFAPDDTCTRADFSIVLIKMLGYDSGVAASNYADVKTSEYYYNYVGIAKEKGIEAGVSENSFRPKTAITREEIMVMVYKGLKTKGITMNTDTAVLNKYTDSNKIAAENKEAVAALINSGTVTGTSDTILDPSSNITRAQMAVLLNNVYGMVK